VNVSALLDVKNLSWKAGDRMILTDIAFAIQPGQFVGLIGPNGAGKSSLMRCLYRVNQPTAGQVLFEGQDIWQQSARSSARNTAVILQEHTAHLGLTVREIVALGLTPHKRLFERDDHRDDRAIHDALTQVDMSDFSEAGFERLSGGEKQRVMLARAMVQKPKFLIMDEPTNHLDVHYQIDVLHKVRALGITVLASFHDLNLAAAFCDTLLVLDHGRLVANGSPESVLSEDLIARIFHTCAVVDRHPIDGHPRISYAYHA